MANIALETNRIAAKIALAQKKYDEAWTSAKFLLTNSQTALTSEEIILLATVADLTVPSLRAELYTIGASTQEVEDLVRTNLELELLSLSDSLIPHLAKQADEATGKDQAMLQRLLADFYSIVASYHNDETTRRNARQLALHNYHTCVLKFENWDHGEPQQIRAAVNYATFCEDTLQEHDQALTLLTMAFNRVMAYKAKNEQEQKSGTELLKDIRSKLESWFPDDEEKEENKTDGKK